MDFWELMLARKLGGGGIDTSADTVTADAMLAGYTAHNAAGEQIIGSIPTYEGECGSGAIGEWFDDGNTHIWIELREGRTSPMLGLCPKGTVTVDWGDGTEPDVLTGTTIGSSYSPPLSDVVWTPTHNYAKAGSYIITLTVDGKAAFGGGNNNQNGSYLLRHRPEEDGRNYSYGSAIKKVEVGENITFNDKAFGYLHRLRDLKIPDAITYWPSNFVITCTNLEKIYMPDSVKNYGAAIFMGCNSLKEVRLSETATKVYSSTVANCYGITNLRIPAAVVEIQSGAFSNCYSMKFYDFSNHTAIPTLLDATVFKNIPADCEIRVPAALVEEWKAATNWSTYADYIVGV